MTTYLGFDFGTKRIGIAVGQTTTRTAQPLETVKTGNWQHITKIIQEWQPDGIVVGIPVNLDGNPETMAQKARYFAEILKSRYHLPVYEADERLTTKEARALLYEAGGYKALVNVDSVAAVIILEAWMNT